LWLQLFLKSEFFNGSQHVTNRPLLDACLIVAVGIADLQGRPIGAAGVARAIGYPRGTLVRRLQDLVRDGFLTQDKRRRFQLVDPLFEERLPYIRRSVRMVQAASGELSKMDTSA
jgi:DNA-binding IclR family transcriptional regulator